MDNGAAFAVSCRILLPSNHDLRRGVLTLHTSSNSASRIGRAVHAHTPGRIRSGRSTVTVAVVPPLTAERPAKLSYKLICTQAADAIKQVILSHGNDAPRLLTVDFPPESSETRAGTLVARYENNRNMCEKLLLELGASLRELTNVGGDVSICDNINPQGGGEYLTDDEVMVGLRGVCTVVANRPITALVNAGVDASTLRHVKDLDNGKDIVVLVNCGLERMSFFSKIGFAKYIESFQPVYFLKVFLGTGLLFKCGTENWKAFAFTRDGLKLIQEFVERPQIYKVEELLRVESMKL